MELECGVVGSVLSETTKLTSRSTLLRVRQAYFFVGTIIGRPDEWGRAASARGIAPGPDSIACVNEERYEKPREEGQIVLDGDDLQMHGGCRPALGPFQLYGGCCIAKPVGDSNWGERKYQSAGVEQRSIRMRTPSQV